MRKKFYIAKIPNHTNRNKIFYPAEILKNAIDNSNKTNQIFRVALSRKSNEYIGSFKKIIFDHKRKMYYAMVNLFSKYENDFKDIERNSIVLDCEAYADIGEGRLYINDFEKIPVKSLIINNRFYMIHSSDTNIKF